jgi:hypothetical protein
MKDCQQTSVQSIYEHGVSVKIHVFQLINYLKTLSIPDGWRLPEWLTQYRTQILESLCPLNIIEQYAIYHDCSKPYCRIVDDKGKQHFPNHAEMSYQLWLEIGGNKEVASLIKMDMDIHLLKDIGVLDFCKKPQAITLLLTGLAEIHSNSKMFGGIESSSFKIKYKQIERRGNAICKRLFT